MINLLKSFYNSLIKIILHKRNFNVITQHSNARQSIGKSG